jgi:ferritin-like metal-binding protein YciE
MAKVTSLDELFIDEIRDLYDAEKQLTKALPKMVEWSSSDDLRAAFETHLEETRGHVERLEQIFASLDQKATGKKCAAMAGLVKEAEELAGEVPQNALRDAGLIAAAQKVEHYEMSGYGSARTHAQILQHADAVALLEQTLSEEKAADKKLNDIAENIVNEEAAEILASGNGSQTQRTGAPKTRTTGGR